MAPDRAKPATEIDRMLSPDAYECPPELLERARHGRTVRMAVVGAGDPLSLESARLACEAGLIEPYLIGDEARVRSGADTLGWPIDAFPIVSARDEHEAASIATALAREGTVGALMKGHVHTDALMRAVVNRETGLRTGRRLSHAFYMTVPRRPGALVITDAAINVEPDPDQLVDIARNAVRLMHALGQDEPKVAVLSATEQPSPGMPSSVRAAEVAKRAAAGAIVGALVAGPMALDSAVSPRSATIKGLRDPVAGKAEVLVVPNIETGNALFKAMVYLMSATAAGVVLGARVPIVLTSRADPPEARLASAALAAVVTAYEATGES